ncbi:FAD-dependent monooxygenase [Microlunatus sp. GCM10028923]|uniref:FAD-dependent monooxygenase n=1 Tax=Microlunatus sp. GCM10028923 TaxID=3273400 RepID=UPI0036084D9A
MKARALIVGAGIGGLAAAIALDRVGWDVTVFERSDRLGGDAGAGLSLAPNAMRCLDELGVGDQARAVSSPTQATGTIRQPDGRHLVRADPAVPAPLRGFRRSQLHRVLLAAAESIPVCRGAEVTRVRAADQVMIVEHAHGQAESELVIGADGIWSTVRRQVVPTAGPPTFLDCTAWLGVVEHPDGTDGLAGSMTIGRGRYFLIHPLGDGHYYWALGARADRPGVRHEDELAVVLDQVRDWHAPIPDLVAATTTIRHIDIHEVQPLDRFVLGRSVLLGDAAHAMSPDRGQGAGQSLEDAVVLAHHLAGQPDLDHALAAYDRSRRPRVQAIARDAHRTGQLMLNLGPLGYRLLTGAFRLTPSRLWNRLTAPDSNPVWRWRPPGAPDH